MTDSASAAAPARADAAPPVNPWLAMVAIAFGMVVVLLDGTITAVANPVLAEDLEASLGDLQWITNVYLLALAATLVLSGKLGDRFGRKRVFLIGVVGFGISSVWIGTSPAVWSVIAARVFQGLFGSLIVTNALALLRATFPADQLPKALGVFGALTGVSSAAGPIIGGLIVEYLSWRWAFFVNAPVAIVAIVVGIRALRAEPPTPQPRFDIAGMVLLVGTLVAFTYGVIRAPEEGWGDTLVVALLALSVVLGALFVAVEARAIDPLMPLRLFRDRSISAGALLTLVAFFALVGSLFFVMLFLQQVGGDTPVEAGLQVLPLSVGSVVGSGVASALLARFGARVPLVGGMLLTALAMVLMTRVDVGFSYPTLGVPFLVLGFGLGLVMPASIQAVVGNAKDEDAGPASGLQQTANQIGGVIGTSVLGAIMAAVAKGAFADELTDRQVPDQVVGALSGEAASAVSQGVAPVPPGSPGPLAEAITSSAHAAFVSGMHTTMLVGAGLAVVGALIALVVRRGRVVDGGVPMH
ncbi:MFS transporter [Patulibacter sp. S7RM1-6]